MKPKVILNTLIIALCFTLHARAQETYRIDPMHTSVSFSVKHLVLSNVKGKFNQFTGAVVLAGQTIKEADGTIQTKSIDTGIAQRDNDLRSANYFDAEKYPTITFKTKRVEQQGDQTVLIADFTMHGVTKELSLPTTLNGPIKDPWGNRRIGLEAKAKLNRKDYGIAPQVGKSMVGEEIEIEINAEATLAAAEKNEK